MPTRSDETELENPVDCALCENVVEDYDTYTCDYCGKRVCEDCIVVWAVGAYLCTDCYESGKGR